MKHHPDGMNFPAFTHPPQKVIEENKTMSAIENPSNPNKTSRLFFLHRSSASFSDHSSGAVSYSDGLRRHPAILLSGNTHKSVGLPGPNDLRSIEPGLVHGSLFFAGRLLHTRIL